MEIEKELDEILTQLLDWEDEDTFIAEKVKWGKREILMVIEGEKEKAVRNSHIPQGGLREMGTTGNYTNSMGDVFVKQGRG